MAILLVFGTIPGNAELVGNLVNGIEVISKVLIFDRVGGMIGEVKTGEMMVFIEFLSLKVQPLYQMWPLCWGLPLSEISWAHYLHLMLYLS